MPEADPHTEVDLTIDDKRRKSTMSKGEWIGLLTGGGFAVFIAIMLANYVLGEGKASGEFQRTTFQQNTTALNGVSSSLTAINTAITNATAADVAGDAVLAEALDDFTAEIDDLGDVVREQSKNLEAYLDQAAEPPSP